MGWPDYAILGAIAISVLVGALRGFIKEVLALVIWALAFVLAYRFAGDLGSMMEAQVSLPSARLAMGFAGIFLVVLVLGGLLVYLVGRLVESTGLSGTDRLLGGVFGAVRGLAIVVTFLLVAGLTPIPADPWWKESPMIQRLMPMVYWVAEFLPESASQHLDFEPVQEQEKTADNAQA
ncbi:MAG TPA: CvpA family protein [Xanthomonadales bacterium]|nr:CvpA family protein [Xanthomonadales bacterium]